MAEIAAFLCLCNPGLVLSFSKFFLPFAIGHPKHKKFFSVFDFVRPWWKVAFLCLPLASPANLEIVRPTFHRIHVLDGFGWFCCTVMSMEYRKFGDHYEVFLHRILSDSWESHGDVSCVIYQEFRV